MSLFGVDIRIWAGFTVAVSGLIGGVKGYFRFRSENWRLAVGNLVVGVIWALGSVIAVLSQFEGTDGVVLPLGAFALLLVVGVFMIIVTGVLGPPSKQGDK